MSSDRIEVTHLEMGKNELDVILLERKADKSSEYIKPLRILLDDYLLIEQDDQGALQFFVITEEGFHAEINFDSIGLLRSIYPNNGTCRDLREMATRPLEER